MYQPKERKERGVNATGGRKVTELVSVSGVMWNNADREHD